MLEVLHPDGFARQTLVLGSACPSGLVLDDISGVTSRGPADVVVLAPSLREWRSRAWLSAAVASMAAGLARDGIGYAIVPRLRRRSTRRLLVAAGLEPHATFVHLPTLARTRHLVPLERGPLQDVAAMLLSARRWESRAMSLVTRVPPTFLAELLGSVGFLVQHPGARSACDWLVRNDGPGRVVVSRSWHQRHGGLVVRDLGRDVPRVAKLKLDARGSTVTTAEARALETTSRRAEEAGAATPSLLSLSTLGDRAVLVQTALPGRVAATALQEAPELLAPTLDRLAAWLGRWHTATAVRRPLTGAQLEDAVLRPAATLEARLSAGRDYKSWLEELSAQVEAQPLARVGVHNDLTMWNVLLQSDGTLGIVDWERADDAGLPLTDFFNAAVDAVAATAGYRDRPAAFRACFTRGGLHADHVARLQTGLVAALGLTTELATLCFHACWLAQATDERRPAEEPEGLPFLHIVDWLARNRDALAFARL